MSTNITLSCEEHDERIFAIVAFVGNMEDEHNLEGDFTLCEPHRVNIVRSLANDSYLAERKVMYTDDIAAADLHRLGIWMLVAGSDAVSFKTLLRL